MSEEQARRDEITPEEIAEYSLLAAGDPSRAPERLLELGGKARRHPPEVIEVGEDYVAYRGGLGEATYLPEQRIRSIRRSSPARGESASAASAPSP